MTRIIKDFVSKSIKNPLLFGSFLMLLGTTVGNFFQFLFNLFMTRNLSVADYGILASLLSLIMLPALFSSAVFPTVVSFAARYFAQDDIPSVRRLFISIAKLSFVLGMVAFLLFLIFSKQIGHFFRIDDQILIILAGVNVFMGFIMIVNMALLQAKLAFTFVSFTNLFSSLLKLIFGAGLVLFGLKVSGAMIGMALAAIAAYLLSFIPLGYIFKATSIDKKFDLLYTVRFGGPAALIFFSLTSLVTIDIVLVKHFF